MRKRGFTLIELIIVIAILAVLAAIIIPTTITAIENAHVAADVSFVAQLNEIPDFKLYERGEVIDPVQIRSILTNKYHIGELATESKGNVIVFNESSLSFELLDISDADLGFRLENTNENANVAYADTAVLLNENPVFPERIIKGYTIISTKGSPLAELIYDIRQGNINNDTVSSIKKISKSNVRTTIQQVINASLFIDDEGDGIYYHIDIESDVFIKSDTDELAADYAGFIENPVFSENATKIKSTTIPENTSIEYLVIPETVNVIDTKAFEKLPLAMISFAQQTQTSQTQLTFTENDVASETITTLSEFKQAVVSERSEDIKFSDSNSSTVKQWYDGVAVSDAFSLENNCRIASNFSALKNALTYGGSDVTVKTNGSFSIKEDITVPLTFTLLVPYSASDYTGIGNGTAESSPRIAAADKLYANLGIQQGKTLTVEGTLIVGGTIGYPGQNYQGHTSDAYSQITNEGTIAIKDTGVLDVYGFVKGNGKVTTESGALVYEPLIVTDYAGGNNTLSLYEDENSPFNRYTVMNIQCSLTIVKGALLKAHCNLYALSSFQKVDCVVVGYSNNEAITDEPTDGIVNLLDGAKVTLTYDGTKYVTGANSSNNLFSDLGRTTFTFQGGARTNALNISVPLVMLAETVSTANVLFPISYYLAYDFTDGTYYINNQIAVFPGAEITVAEDAELIVTDGASLYVAEGISQSAMSGKSYPTADELSEGGFSKCGVLTINGRLTVKSGASFGGFVQSGRVGATITVENGATVNADDYSVRFGGKGYYACNASFYTLNGSIYDSDANTTVSLSSGSTYTCTNTNNNSLSGYFVKKLTAGTMTDNYVYASGNGSAYYLYVTESITLNQTVKGAFSQTTAEKATQVAAWNALYASYIAKGTYTSGDFDLMLSGITAYNRSSYIVRSELSSAYANYLTSLSEAYQAKYSTLFALTVETVGQADRADLAAAVEYGHNLTSEAMTEAVLAKFDILKSLAVNAFINQYSAILGEGATVEGEEEIAMISDAISDYKSLNESYKSLLATVIERLNELRHVNVRVAKLADSSSVITAYSNWTETAAAVNALTSGTYTLTLLDNIEINIALLADIPLNRLTVKSGVTLILEMNGYSIDMVVAANVKNVSSTNSFIIANSGNVTIRNNASAPSHLYYEKEFLSSSSGTVNDGIIYNLAGATLAMDNVALKTDFYDYGSGGGGGASGAIYNAGTISSINNCDFISVEPEGNPNTAPGFNILRSGNNSVITSMTNVRMEGYLYLCLELTGTTVGVIDGLTVNDEKAGSVFKFQTCIIGTIKNSSFSSLNRSVNTAATSGLTTIALIDNCSFKMSFTNVNSSYVGVSFANTKVTEIRNSSFESDSEYSSTKPVILIPYTGKIMKFSGTVKAGYGFGIQNDGEFHFNEGGIRATEKSRALVLSETSRIYYATNKSISNEPLTEGLYIGCYALVDGYNVTLKNYDGEVMDVISHVAGEVMGTPSLIPNRPGSCEFVGWVDELGNEVVFESITSDLTAIAAYSTYDNVKLTSNDRYYMTVNEALEDAIAGDTITLYRSFSESIIVPLGKNVTIDLNGYTVTAFAPVYDANGNASAYTLVNNGTLTLTSSKVVNGEKIKGSLVMYPEVGGSFILNKGATTSVINEISNLSLVYVNTNSSVSASVSAIKSEAKSKIGAIDNLEINVTSYYSYPSIYGIELRNADLDSVNDYTFTVNIPNSSSNPYGIYSLSDTATTVCTIDSITNYNFIGGGKGYALNLNGATVGTIDGGAWNCYIGLSFTTNKVCVGRVRVIKNLDVVAAQNAIYVQAPYKSYSNYLYLANELEGATESGIVSGYYYAENGNTLNFSTGTSYPYKAGSSVIVSGGYFGNGRGGETSKLYNTVANTGLVFGTLEEGNLIYNGRSFRFFTGVEFGPEVKSINLSYVNSSGNTITEAARFAGSTFNYAPLSGFIVGVMEYTFVKWVTEQGGNVEIDASSLQTGDTVYASYSTSATAVNINNVKGYSTLSEAFGAVANGDTIYLTADISESDFGWYVGKTFTFDFQGHALTTGGFTFGGYVAANITFMNGTINAVGSDCFLLQGETDSTVLTFNNMTVNANSTYCDVFYVLGGTLIVNSGSYSGNNSAVHQVNPDASVTLNGGLYKGISYVICTERESVIHYGAGKALSAEPNASGYYEVR